MSTSGPAYFLRPIAEGDLAGLCALVEALTDSITTIPRDPEFLRKRIALSERSFAEGIEEAGGEQYLFVLEEAATGRLVGTTAMIARVGGYAPFYTYRIEEEVFRHEPLGIRKTMDVLTLQANHDGPTEIGSLFLNPAFRKHGLGRLLSLGRFLFLRAFRERFRPTMIAELRGYLNDGQRSPFWDTVASPFFERDFHEADFLSGLGNKDFIRDLMPRHPLYLPLLPQAVQEVIGRVHRDTEPARALLEREGFRWTREVDIFDAGPLLAADAGDIRTVQSARTLELVQTGTLTEPSPPMLLANCALAFRTVIGSWEARGVDRALVTPATAETLRLKPGDRLQAVALK